MVIQDRVLRDHPHIGLLFLQVFMLVVSNKREIGNAIVRGERWESDGKT